MPQQQQAPPILLTPLGRSPEQSDDAYINMLWADFDGPIINKRKWLASRDDGRPSKKAARGVGVSSGGQFRSGLATLSNGGAPNGGVGDAGDGAKAAGVRRVLNHLQANRAGQMPRIPTARRAIAIPANITSIKAFGAPPLLRVAKIERN